MDAITRPRDACATRSEKILRLHGFQDVFDSANRNDDPIRPIVQFVADFVDRFVEQIGFEAVLQIGFAARDEKGARWSP